MAEHVLTERQGHMLSVVALAEREGLLDCGTEGTYIQLTDAGIAWCEKRGLATHGRGYSEESSDGLHEFLKAYARELMA